MTDKRSSLERMSIKSLDALLIAERKSATQSWPYTNKSDKIRSIESEYERRGYKLPENREE